MLLALLALARPAGSPSLAPPVLILDDAADARATTAAETRPRGAALLAAASMAPAERRRLAATLEALAARLEARAHPLGDDFEDGPADAPLHARLRTALPKLTAAHALVAAEWRGSAGGFSVRAADVCPRDRRCVDPWARGGSAAERRARFLAWPVSAATVLAFDDAPAADAAAALLRARSGDPESSIGLVVGGAGDDLLPDLVAIRDAARRVAAHLDGDADPEARALLAEIQAAELPSLPAWLPRGADRVVVIPRLGALATLDAFVADVAAHAAGARVLYRPAPLD